jgi:hypothetical protein
MGLPSTSLCQNGIGKFSTVGNLPTVGGVAIKAAGHTATLLPSGKVLVTDGGNSNAELFDPTTNSWTSALGFSSLRSYHTATLLGNGYALITGGAGSSGNTLKTTNLYNVATGAFTAGPNMTTTRERHTATLLASGNVLIAGGRAFGGSSSDPDDDDYSVLNTAEIYDPVANTFTATPVMKSAHESHAAALVGTEVLVSGGGNGTATGIAAGEFYDPATNTWTTAPCRRHVKAIRSPYLRTARRSLPAA